METLLRGFGERIEWGAAVKDDTVSSRLAVVPLMPTAFEALGLGERALLMLVLLVVLCSGFVGVKAGEAGGAAALRVVALLVAAGAGAPTRAVVGKGAVKVRDFEIALAMLAREEREAVMSEGEARTVSIMPLGELGREGAAGRVGAATTALPPPPQLAPHSPH